DAWIFLDSISSKKQHAVISFAKIRGSYGTTGNDQIGDYGYLNTWNNYIVAQPYQGSTALIPSNLSNPFYKWEVNRKLEAALDVTLGKTINLSFIYYRNRSSNQIIANRLPTQTGAVSIITNFPALVQNSGFEMEAGIKK